MNSKKSSNVYQRVIETTQTYLGPAAERFIDRQVKNHLDKEPHQLIAEDISKLIDWIRISVSFLTEDSQLIEEYVHQLRQIEQDEQRPRQ